MYAKGIDLRNMVLWSIGVHCKSRSHPSPPNYPVSATGPCQSWLVLMSAYKCSLWWT